MIRLFNKNWFSTVKVNIDLLKRIRAETSAPISQCKSALEESGNSYEQALKWLKKKGMSVAEKHADKFTREGVIAVAVNQQRDTGVMLQVNCETDFVAKNQLFLRFVNKLLHSTLSNQTSSVQLSSLQKQDEASKATDAFLQKMNPLQVFDDSCLNALEEKKYLISKVQQNVRVRRILKLHSPKAKIGYYVHRQYQKGIGLQACLVELLAQSELHSPEYNHFADNIATQILGAPPKYLSEAEIPENVMAQEKQKITDSMSAALAKAPVDAHPRMIQGKLNAVLFEPFVFTHMGYIMNPSGDMTVGEYWKNTEHELGTKISLKRVETWKCK